MSKTSRRRSAVAGVAKQQKSQRGRYRIIGGTWRGRRIDIPVAADLRPTPDRVRETLFNWLSPVIDKSVCLDLFAGSGALGFEALSRGAGGLVMVESQPQVVAQLRKQLEHLGGKAEILSADALGFLQGKSREFDCVFLDPPYRAELLGTVCLALESGGWLSDDAFIYLEHHATRPLPQVPPGWQHWRQGRAGQVAFHLFRRGQKKE